MTPEEKSLLQSTYDLTKENNELLRKMRRSAKLATGMRIVYWVVIIGASFGAFYLIEPYMKFLTDLAGPSGSSVGQNIQDLLK